MYTPKLIALLMAVLAMTASAGNVKVSFGDDDPTPAPRARRDISSGGPALAARWAMPEPLPLRRRPAGAAAGRPGKAKGRGGKGMHGRPRAGKGAKKGGKRHGPGGRGAKKSAPGGKRGGRGGPRGTRGPKGGRGQMGGAPSPPPPPPPPAVDVSAPEEAQGAEDVPPAY